MTEKLFYDDGMAREFDAVVVSCEKCDKKNLYELVLDRTLFYPEGGGQPCDHGNINGLAVNDVRDRDGEVIHYITAKLEEGSHVHGMIDGKRRIDMTQQHTGEHIVSGIIHSMFGYDNVGFHIGEEFVQLDFNGMLTERDIQLVEDKANEAIYENQPIIVTYPSPEELAQMTYRSKKELTGRIRIVQVGNCDICACCGTHFTSTGPVGIIKLVNHQKYKNGVRIFMMAGRRALEDYRIKNRMIFSLSAKTSAKPYEVENAIDRIFEDWNNQKAAVNALSEQLIDYKVKEIPEGTDKICVFEENMSPVELRKYCNALCERAEIAMACSGDDENGYKYTFGSTKKDVRELGKELNKKLNGKGGGKDLIQGSLSCTRADIEKFFEKI